MAINFPNSPNINDTHVVGSDTWICTHVSPNRWAIIADAQTHNNLTDIGTYLHTEIDSHIDDVNNPHTVTKTQVGLSNVDNTSDTDKPISTATQTELDLKAPLDSPELTGIPLAPTATTGTSTTQIATTAFVQGELNDQFGNVDNTSDTDKPVSTATQTALDLKSDIASPTFTGVATFEDTITDDATLSAIDVSNANTVVAVFKGSTDTDFDPNWREKARWTSWYKELGDFPRNYIIEALANQVNIYDADGDMSTPWMVFSRGTNYYLRNLSIIVSTVSMKNGILYIGDDVSLHGITAVNFKTDEAFNYRLDALYKYPLPISGRNTAGGIYAYDSTVTLVNGYVNDIAVTNDAYGNNIVAVATDGGVSVIYEKTGEVSSTATGYVISKVEFDGEYIRAINVDTNDQYCDTTYYNGIPTGGPGRLASYWNVVASNIYEGFGYGISYPLQTTGHTLANGNIGSNLGLSVLKIEHPTNGSSLASITNTYSTGYMHGDIKGCWLSDSDTSSLIGSELVTNGDFNTDVSGWSAVNGCTFSFDSNAVKILRDAGSGGIAQVITTVIGETYTISAEDVGGTVSFYLYIQGVFTQIPVNSSASYTFVANSTDTTIQINSGTGSTDSNYALIDNITCRLAVEDRSVNNNGLAVNGTITRTALGTDGDSLVAYSGFSASNYFSQAYSADLDFGTGDFSISILAILSTGGPEVLLSRYDPSAAGNVFSIRKQSANTITFNTNGGGLVLTSTSNILGKTHITVKRVSGILYLYINGILNSSATHTTDYTNVTAKLGIGIIPTTIVSSPLINGSLALIKISKTAPTAEQIKEQYELEKPMFDGLPCLLSGSTNVLDMAYIDKTDELKVLTSDAVDTFQGLIRTNTRAVSGFTSISADASGIEVLGG